MATIHDTPPPATVLAVHSSGRHDGSTTRRLADDLVRALQARCPHIDVVERDLARGVPLIDAGWIDANFTPEDDRTDAQRRALAASDELVEELRAADVLVVGVPLYNFGIPAALKAWIDMVTRARLTFRYKPDGPVGLLGGKKAYLVMASGGVAVGSDADFATPYLRHALRFIGITDVEVIAADQINRRGDDALDTARLLIAERIHTAGPLAADAA